MMELLDMEPGLWHSYFFSPLHPEEWDHDGTFSCKAFAALPSHCFGLHPPPTPEVTHIISLDFFFFSLPRRRFYADTNGKKPTFQVEKSLQRSQRGKKLYCRVRIFVFRQCLLLTKMNLHGDMEVAASKRASST